MDNNRELDQEEVRNKLSEFIEEQGLRVEKVAEMLFLSATQVSGFKTGRLNLSNKSLLMLDSLMNTYKVEYSLRG